ncbi:hypothetical protein VKT23_018590 [Stygiomarasmius scandens]|uniref:Uncharacterized protein n=1 Tax=Marasmiellus scandens TaxID=2682957 RepID=A0ABR1IQW7_9AGAR
MADPNPSKAKKNRKSKQNVDRRSTIQEKISQFTNEKNLQTITEERNSIHFKPVHPETQKKYEEIKIDFAAFLASSLKISEEQVLTTYMHHGSTWFNLAQIKTFFEMMAKTGRSRLGEQGWSQKTLLRYRGLFVSMWYQATLYRPSTHETSQLTNFINHLVINERAINTKRRVRKSVTPDDYGEINQQLLDAESFIVKWPHQRIVGHALLQLFKAEAKKLVNIFAGR